MRVSISTNGLSLLRQPALLEALAARTVVISLQFDGFHDRVYEVLRGRPLLREKLAMLGWRDDEIAQVPGVQSGTRTPPVRPRARRDTPAALLSRRLRITRSSSVYYENE